MSSGVTKSLRYRLRKADWKCRDRLYDRSRYKRWQHRERRDYGSHGRVRRIEPLFQAAVGLSLATTLVACIWFVSR